MNVHDSGTGVRPCVQTADCPNELAGETPVPLPDMSEFRYQAVETDGASVAGVIEAEDRKSALRLLGQRGLFPSKLELKFAPKAQRQQSAGRNTPAAGRQPRAIPLAGASSGKTSRRSRAK